MKIHNVIPLLLLLSCSSFSFADVTSEPDSICEDRRCQEVCDVDQVCQDTECCQESDCHGAPTFCDFASTLFCPRSCDCYPLGFYLGGSVNYTHFWGHHEDYFRSDLVSDGKQKFHDDTASVNLFVGYLTCIPCCESFVLGIEPYISVYNYNNFSVADDVFFDNDTADFGCRRRIHGGVAFRLGYIMPCNFLVYGLVGPDIARFEFDGRAPGSTDKVTSSRNLCGIIYGVGVEKPLCWCNVILGLQATITQYGSHTFSGTNSDDENTTTHITHPKAFDLAFRLSVPLN